MVERTLGKGEVESSILSRGTIFLFIHIFKRPSKLTRKENGVGFFVLVSLLMPS